MTRRPQRPKRPGRATTSPPAGVILAAGASRRMGRAKALLEVDGSRLVAHLAGLLHDGGCCAVYVVVGGQWADTITAELAVSFPAAMVVTNPDPERGMLSSLQSGLARAGSKTVIFTPVDLPLLSADPVQALVSSRTDHAVLVPTFNGRSGHPVLLREPAIAALLAADPHESAREVLARFERLEIGTDQPGICGNMNTPDDAREWLNLETS